MFADAIRRWKGGAPGRSRASAWRDLVFTVATGSGDTILEQTERALETIDRNLLDARSDKTRVLSATVYLSDMTDKAAMDAVWTKWIGPEENWPQRACIGAALAEGHLVEITLVATRKQGS